MESWITCTGLVFSQITAVHCNTFGAN